MRATRFATAIALTVPLGACGLGLATPEIEDFTTPQNQEMLLENVLVNNIKCELTLGYLSAMNYVQNAPLANDVSWFTKWGATTTLKITADEKSSLSPGLSLTTPFQNAVTTFPKNGNVTSPQNFTFGLGVSGSADATRVETIAFTYSFDDLMKEYQRRPFSSCSEHEQGVMINSDLKIGQFIMDKLFLASVPGTIEANSPIPGGQGGGGGAGGGGGGAGGGHGNAQISEKDIESQVVAELIKPKSKLKAKSKQPAAPKASPYFSTFSYQVTFVATFSGNATPTWKFARVSADPSSPTFMAQRTKTNDLTITFGEITKATDSSPNTLASLEAQNVNLAALIGQSVATAIQSQQH